VTPDETCTASNYSLQSKLALIIKDGYETDIKRALLPIQVHAWSEPDEAFFKHFRQHFTEHIAMLVLYYRKILYYTIGKFLAGINPSLGLARAKEFVSRLV